MMCFKTMGKHFLCLFISILFITALPVYPKSKFIAQKLEFKLTGGLTRISGEDWNSIEKGWDDFNYQNIAALGGTATGHYQMIHLGKEFGGDFLFYLRPNLAGSVGVGYMCIRETGDDNKLVTERGGSVITNTIAMKVRSIPVRVGVHYFLPLFAKSLIALNAGAGIYFTCFSREYYRGNPADYWINDLQKGKGSGIGIHGGIGWEYDIHSSLTILIEASGRYAKISGFKGTRDQNDSNNWSDSLDDVTLYYREQERAPFGWYPQVSALTSAPSGPNIRNVRKGVVDLSGFNIQIGFKIKLF